MALRAGYYGVKRSLKDKLEYIAKSWDKTLEDIGSNISEEIIETVGWLGKNYLKHTLASLKTLNTGGSWVDNVYTYNGITFTINDDASITVESEEGATAGTQFFLTSYGKFLPANKNLKISGCAGGSSTTYKLDVTTSQTPIATCYTTPVMFSYDNAANYRSRIVVYKDATPNERIYPMIYDADLIDEGYVPGHVTVDGLIDTINDTLSDHKTTINAIIAAATGAADFAAFKAAMEAITPVTRSLSTAAAPEELVKEEITEEPVVEKKTTKKKTTAKAETQEEV